jgi:hypothetical protein
VRLCVCAFSKLLIKGRRYLCTLCPGPSWCERCEAKCGAGEEAANPDAHSSERTIHDRSHVLMFVRRALQYGRPVFLRMADLYNRDSVKAIKSAAVDEVDRKQLIHAGTRCAVCKKGPIIGTLYRYGTLTIAPVMWWVVADALRLCVFDDLFFRAPCCMYVRVCVCAVRTVARSVLSMRCVRSVRRWV